MRNSSQGDGPVFQSAVRCAAIKQPALCLQTDIICAGYLILSVISMFGVVGQSFSNLQLIPDLSIRQIAFIPGELNSAPAALQQTKTETHIRWNKTQAPPIIKCLVLLWVVMCI